MSCKSLGRHQGGIAGGEEGRARWEGEREAPLFSDARGHEMKWLGTRLGRAGN